MKAQAYHDLKRGHEQELSEFPVAYVFNNEQFDEALSKLGSVKGEVYSVFGIGDIAKKDRCLGLNEQRIHAMGLEEAYSRARRSRFKHMEEWGVI